LDTQERGEAFLDQIFGEGMGARHTRFLDHVEDTALRDVLHGCHVLESDDTHLSTAENYLLGMTVCCALRSYAPAGMFAKTLRQLGVPREKILAAVTRLSLWVGPVPAAEAAAHMQRALREWDVVPRAAAGRVTGRRGLVVGVSGADSLGAACARQLVSAGAEVVVTCRPARLEAVTVEAATWGVTRVLPLDVDDPASVAAVFAVLAESWGALDFLVHSLVHVPAPVLERPLVELRRDEFEKVLSIGAWSLVSLCGHALPLLRLGVAPRVVTISSACGQRFTPRYHVAGIAKAALESAVVYLAGELGPEGIAVNAVSPPLLATAGAVATVGAEACEATRRHQARRSFTRSVVEPGDVADVVSWLCSPVRQVTGQVITVDGGFTRAYL
jgi:enoyl-[acyl-carrier protein] reductase I